MCKWRINYSGQSLATREQMRAPHLISPRSRKNPFALLTDCCFIKMADDPVLPRPMLHKLQLCFKTDQSPVRMNFPSPVFRWRSTPSLFTALPLAPVRFLHVNVLLLFYPIAVLFVLCLAICGFCSAHPSAPPKVLVLSPRLP